MRWEGVGVKMCGVRLWLGSRIEIGGGVEALGLSLMEEWGVLQAGGALM